jgi:fructosamine-3-kinase
MLDAMDFFPPVKIENFCIRTPHLYYSNKNTHILEDLAGTMDLKTVLKSDASSKVLTQLISTAIGRVVGYWLRKLHNWASEPKQAGLQKYMEENNAMREVRYKVSYGAFIDIVRKFPKVWEASGNALEQARDMAAAEYAITASGEQGESWSIIHGDFWSGK